MVKEDVEDFYELHLTALDKRFIHMTFVNSL